jgi:hypothetical protein
LVSNILPIGFDSVISGSLLFLIAVTPTYVAEGLAMINARLQAVLINRNPVGLHIIMQHIR